MSRPGRRTEIGPIETVDARRRILPLLIFVGVVATMFWWASDALADQFAERGDGVVVDDIEVPFLSKVPLIEAIDKVESLGLEVEYLFAPNEVIPFGAVSAQRPLPGTKLISGSLVLLLVSEGPAQYMVPDVAGQQWQDAADVITVANLTPKPEAAFSETVRIGEVIETRPSPGKSLPIGSPVVIVVSGGKSPKIVPKVEGLRIEEGMNQIGLAGLGIGSIVREYTGAEPGIVLRTEPGAGALLGRAQPVTVVVTGPAPTVEVPSVEALREADAVSKMQEAGLDVTVRPWQVPTGAPEVGRVIRQGIPPAAKVPPNFKVELLVGVAPPPPTTAPPVTSIATVPTVVTTVPTSTTVTVSPTPTSSTTTAPGVNVG